MLLVKPNGGLCNRMRVIKSLLALKANCNQKQRIWVVWEKNDELNAPFNILFKSIKGINVITTTPLQTRFLYFLFNRILRFKIYLKNDILKYFKRTSNIQDLFFLNKNVIIETDIDFFMPEYKASDFKLVNNLKKVVDEFIFQNKINETIGMHIRRTDNKVAIENSPIFLFYNEIENELINNNDLRFFVASDDDTEILKLKQKFPNKIITFASNKQRNNYEGIKQAVIELFILSSSKKIYGTYWSSFSEMAIQLNNNKESRLLKII